MKTVNFNSVLNGLFHKGEKFNATLISVMLKLSSKKQKRIIFTMLSLPVTPAVKRLIVEYNKPTNIAQLASYYLNILGTLATDTLFTTYTTLLDSAVVQCKKLRDAQTIAEGQAPGTAQLRNVQLLLTESIMFQVLATVQLVGDNNLPLAEAIFKSHNLKIKVYGRHEKDEYTVTCKDGVFTVINRPVGTKGSNADYLRMISIDGKRWEVGDLSRKSTKGNITKCGDDSLVIGMLYYHRMMTDSSDGKSSWSDVIQMYCV